MEPATGILVMADISGYTAFLHRPELCVRHAHQIVGRLLETVVDAAEPTLVAEKLEGDAALFLRASSAASVQTDAVLARERLLPMWVAFEAERRALLAANDCACDACVATEALRLKLFCHLDEVVRHRIGRFEEIGGAGVILIHRLLKNSVAQREYVLMTERFAQHAGDLDGHAPLPHAESYEPIGQVAARLFVLEGDAATPPADDVASREALDRDWVANVIHDLTSPVPAGPFHHVPAGAAS